MQAVTLKEAKRSLLRLVEQVLADAEPRIVVTDKGDQVVLMPLDEFLEGNALFAGQTGQRGPSAAFARGGSFRSDPEERAGGRMNLTFTPSGWDDYLYFQHESENVIIIACRYHYAD